MGLSKIREIRGMSDNMLDQEIDKVKRNLFDLRFENATGRPVKPHLFKHARHRIAQLLTVKSERNRAEHHRKHIKSINHSSNTVNKDLKDSWANLNTDYYLRSFQYEKLSNFEVDTNIELLNRNTVLESDELNPKQINVWITERPARSQEVLMVDISCILNFMIGEPMECSIEIDSNSSKIYLSELDKEGLDTRWVVSSSTIRLEASSYSPQVSFTHSRVGSQESWLAKFPLFIPHEGNSKKVELLITPKNDKEMSLDILVYARGEIFRQFDIQLDAEDVKLRNSKVVSIKC
jgi:large subunit ribosomal protein L29